MLSAPRFAPLLSGADVVGALGADPFPRYELDPAAPTRGRLDRDTGAVAFLRSGARGLSLVALAPPPPRDRGPGTPAGAEPGARIAPAMSVLLAEVEDDVPVDRALVPRGALPRLTAPGGGAGPGPEPVEDWDWMWTTAPPPPVPGEHEVGELADDDEVAHLLAVASPRHGTVPGEPDVLGWAGVRDGDGRLLACGAVRQRIPGVAHLASIATHPAARRRGLALAVTAALTRRALAGGARGVTLGVYADNVPARTLYARLGFRLGHSFSTLRLVRG